MTIVPNKYQVAIYDFVKYGKGNGIVEAVAGSGKTTTIVEALKLVDRNKRCLFVAFNKHIAEELERRVPPYVEASTLHSLGYGIMRKNLGFMKVNDRKIANILKYKMFNMDDKKSAQTCFKVIGAVCKLVGLLKAHAVNPDTDGTYMWEELAEKHNINVPDVADVDFDGVLRDCFNRSNQQWTVIDYDDMLYWPATRCHNLPQYDMIFVDEVQDLNPVQMDFIRKIGTHGRIIAVGDTYQGIYGFRGADPDAMQNFRRAISATILPLSVCFRCSQSVVREASVIVPHIEPSPTAVEGKVQVISQKDFRETVVSGEYALCRITAELVKECLLLIRKGKKAMVRGKDIGEGLKDTLYDIGVTDGSTFDDYAEKASAYRERMTEKFRYKEMELATMNDTIDTLDAVRDACLEYQPTGGVEHIVGDIARKIDSIFSETDAGIVFSTIHKAKGLEAPTVYILRPDLLPHPKAEKDWQIVQEHNLKYVAITRAKVNLFYVGEGNGNDGSRDACSDTAVNRDMVSAAGDSES